MVEEPSAELRDWASSVTGFMMAWGLPTFVIISGIFVNAQTRTILWAIALTWKGTACLLNARRCGRIHCRFTGPFYLFMIVPVLLHGLGLLPLGTYGWWVLGIIILFGGKLIWWATETAWGKYSIAANSDRTWYKNRRV